MYIVISLKIKQEIIMIDSDFKTQILEFVFEFDNTIVQIDLKGDIISFYFKMIIDE